MKTCILISILYCNCSFKLPVLYFESGLKHDSLYNTGDSHSLPACKRKSKADEKIRGNCNLMFILLSELALLKYSLTDK